MPGLFIPVTRRDIEMLFVCESVSPSRNTVLPITSPHFDAGSPYSHHTMLPTKVSDKFEAG